MARNKDQGISLIIAAILLISVICFPAFAQSPTDGRFLENGKWQPRNSRVNIEIPPPGNGQTEPSTYLTDEESSTINWEPDVRLSFDNQRVFDASITEGLNGYVYAVSRSHKTPESGFYVRSTSCGVTWEPGIHLFVDDPILIGEPQINADSNLITIVFNNGTYQFSIYSNDFGQTWSDWNNGNVANSTGRAVFDGALIYVAVSDPTFDLTQVRHSTNYGINWNWHSNVNHISGEVDIGVNDSGLHVGQAGPGGEWCEAYYMRYLPDSSRWTSPLLMSSYDTSASFWPRIKAWDNNVVVYWTDYKYSPYSWTGDILMRRSTDNGLTWSDEIQATTSHLTLAKDMCERNDTLFLVYDEVVLDGVDNTEEIFFSLSPDGGLTWEMPIRLTNSIKRSVEPAVAVKDNRIHIAFCDARDQISGNELYYKRGLITSSGIIDQKPLASFFGLRNYPNPFNGKTRFEFNLPAELDVRLNIYDISGRLIKQLDKRRLAAGTHRLEWEGRDTSGKEVSSGLYIATLAAGIREDVIKIAIVK